MRTVFLALTRWFGIDGTRALFTRALGIAREDHQSLAAIRVRGTEPYFEGVATIAKSNGDAATSDAIEAVILTVIVLLERQIGSALTRRLLDPDAITEAGDEERSQQRGGNEK